MTYKDVLLEIGEFGAYQKRLCLVIFMSTMTCAFGTLTMIFTMYTPDHRCKIPVVDEPLPYINQSVLQNKLLSFLIPEDDDGTNLARRKCNRFKTSGFDLRNNASWDESRLNANVTKTEIPCDKGWQFLDESVSTVVTDFQLVCEDAWLKPLTVSLFMAGEAFGSVIGGVLADRFGRRRVFLWGKLIEFTLYFLVGFSPNISAFIALMAVTGAFVYLPYTSAFVLGNEAMGDNHRNIISLCVYGGYCFGAATVPIIGYLISDWRWIMRVTGLMGILYIPYYWIILESPYWLLSSGRTEDAQLVLCKMAKINGKSLPSECKLIDKFNNPAFNENKDPLILKENNVQKNSHEYSFLYLLRSPTMRCRLVVAYISWIVTNMVYYGLALNITAFSGDRYVNAAVSGLLEFPGIIGGFFVIQWLGRPLSLSLFMGFGGMCLAVAPFIKQVNQVAMTAMVILGKTSLIGAFYINFSITGEMSPTLLRNIMVGSASAVGKIGSFTAPYLMFLGETTSEFVPFIVMGSLALISSLMSILKLPETKGTTLPARISDAEALKTRF